MESSNRRIWHAKDGVLAHLGELLHPAGDVLCILVEPGNVVS